MDSFLLYILKSGICLILFYLLYWLLFRNNTFFRINRLYLIITVILAVILPSIKFNLNSEAAITVYAKMLDPISVSPANVQKVSTQTHIFQILFILYILGTFILILRLLYQLIRILLLVKRHGITNQHGIKTVYVTGNNSPSSFFSIIFLPQNGNQREILEHELAHVRQRHTLDVLFMEIAVILQWFNPAIWYYRSSLKNIHEFLADREIIKSGINKVNYQYLMLNSIFGVRINELTTSFNYSILKKRIMMMTTNNTKKSMILKYLIIIPLVAGMLIYFGCQDSDILDISEKTETILPAEEYNNQQTSELDEVFAIVEEMPTFQGGDIDNFRKWIQENVEYPKSAMEKGISGKVIIQFVINTEGKVVNAEVKQSVSPELDQEAIRVISASPAWIPGSQRGRLVNVQYFMPISFGIQASEEKVTAEEEIFYVVDKMPMFQGGDLNNFRKWAQQNVVYPEEAIKNKIQGRVFVQFAINSRGEVVNAIVLRKVDPLLDAEALRVIKSSPKWEPGEQRSRKVTVQYNMPISFALQ